MDLTFEFEGLEELRARLEAGDVALSEGIARAVEEGLDEGVTYARANHNWHDQTGELSRSIDKEIESTGPGGTEGVLLARAEYASYLEEGTQPHEIVANGGALHWQQGGSDRFAKSVNHPGTQPTPFMQPAAAHAAEHTKRSIELDVLLNVKSVVEGG